MKKSSRTLNKGKLYLIPTILAKNSEETVLNNDVKNHIKRINIFIVENIRTARRYLKKIDKNKEINNTIFYLNNKHNTIDLEKDLFSHIFKGEDVGLLSESGLPCIADPGSNIVKYAHKFQIQVIPLVGPSSIILALMASGMNGQNFAFTGYLPIEKKARKNSIKKIEFLATTIDQAQIFMETPYRNNQLFETLKKECNNTTNLCIACNITAKNEFIKTKTISEWKHSKINLHKQPTIFIIS